MRNKKRIPICLKLLFKDNILSHFLTEHPGKIIDNIYQNWGLIEKKWNKYPGYRFGQLLSNLNLVDQDIENIIWNIEEDDWLINNGYVSIEDIKFWGVNYYKNNKPRKKTKYVLLKDLKTDHIENIIKFFGNRLNTISPKYLEYFNKRILTEKSK